LARAPDRRGRIPTALRCAHGLALLVALARPAEAAPATPDHNGARWAAGPVRWLLLADERAALRKVASQEELERFVATFWQRRDAQPEAPGNPLMEAFAHRVEAADQLYGEGDTRGSLSDRGRVLVLLGSPAGLRTTHHPRVGQTALQARPADGEPRTVGLEIWSYHLVELPPGVRAALEHAGVRNTLTLTFVRGDHHTRLTGGEKLLRAVARGLATPAPEEGAAATTSDGPQPLP